MNEKSQYVYLERPTGQVYTVRIQELLSWVAEWNKSGVWPVDWTITTKYYA